MTSAPHTDARDTKHLLDETRVLLATAIKDSAARIAADARPAADDNAHAFVARIARDLNAAKAEYAARTRDQQREDVRFVCDTLQLFRACPRARCPKARTCRGDAQQCRARFHVPQQAEHYAATRLLAHLMPWLPMRGADAERMAFECWIAGMEAGDSHRSSPRKRGPRAGEEENGFPLTRE